MGKNTIPARGVSKCGQLYRARFTTGPINTSLKPPRPPANGSFHVWGGEIWFHSRDELLALTSAVHKTLARWMFLLLPSIRKDKLTNISAQLTLILKAKFTFNVLAEKYFLLNEEVLLNVSG